MTNFHQFLSLWKNSYNLYINIIVAAVFFSYEFLSFESALCSDNSQNIDLIYQHLYIIFKHMLFYCKQLCQQLSHTSNTTTSTIFNKIVLKFIFCLSFEGGQLSFLNLVSYFFLPTSLYNNVFKEGLSYIWFAIQLKFAF